MAILSPHQIHNALQEVKRATPALETKDLETLLQEHQLSPKDLLENLAELIRSGDSSATRVNATKIGLQLNNLLRNDQAVNAPVVNIIIHDADYGGVNPILIPR
jgi:hypothetical protein